LGLRGNLSWESIRIRDHWVQGYYTLIDESEVWYKPPFIGTFLYCQNRGIVGTGAFDQEALLLEVIYDSQETSLGLWF
jgi:hypothetical protein